MIWTMLAVLLAVATTATSDCSLGTAEVCEKFSGHSSSGFVQVHDSPSLVTLEPVSRTYVTADLDKSVAWFAGMFNAVEVPLNLTYHANCARAKALMWLDVEIIFVEYMDSHLAKYIKGAEDQWNDVSKGEYDYTRWIDNHDGFNCVPEAINETFLFESEFAVQKGGMFSRLLIPKTCWAIELSGMAATEYVKQLEASRTFKTANADFTCRVPLGERTDEAPFSSRFWWKSTFASADPEAAASFAETYLFGTWITSEYPLGGNCTLSAWVLLPHTTYQLHFAHTNPCETPSPNIDEWVTHQEAIRSLESGKFDQHMSNNLVFWANTLDPIVTRLLAGNIPFLILELGPGIHGLYVSIPHNAITLQIRSNYLTAAQPLGVFDACAGDEDFLLLG